MESPDIQHTQIVLGEAMLLAALGTFVLCQAGRWIGGVWTTLLATLAAMLLAYQPLIGASLFAGFKTDLLRRILIAGVPFTVVVAALSFKKVPTITRVLWAMVGPALLLIWVFWHFDVSVPRADLLFHKIVPLAAVIFIMWALIEMIARRSPGAAVPIVIGLITGGLAFLLMLSAESQAGQLAPIIPATALGGLAAAITAFFLGKPISFARGPVLLWLTLIVALFAFMWLDTDELPARYLCWIAAAPLLAWIAEIGPIRRLKRWKRESIRLVLVSIPVLIAVALAFKQHHDDAKAAGDEFGLRWPSHHTAAPILPNQMPRPNTINPPTMT